MAESIHRSMHSKSGTYYSVLLIAAFVVIAILWAGSAATLLRASIP